jgi:hypothetical protein
MHEKEKRCTPTSKMRTLLHSSHCFRILKYGGIVEENKERALPATMGLHIHTKNNQSAEHRRLQQQLPYTAVGATGK